MAIDDMAKQASAGGESEVKFLTPQTRFGVIRQFNSDDIHSRTQFRKVDLCFRSLKGV